MSRAAPVPVRHDYATGDPVCVVCDGSLDGRSAAARFCSHACRTAYHNTPDRKARRRAEGKLG